MHRRTKNILITVSIVAVIGLLALYGFLMLIKSSITRTAETELHAAETTTREESNRNLKALFSDLGPSLDKLKSHVVTENSVVPFIEMVETLAHEAGATISIDDVGVTPATEFTDTHERLKLSILTQGSWQAVYRFLQMMETLPYRVAIDNVEFSERTTDETGKPASGQWHSSMVMYVMKHK